MDNNSSTPSFELPKSAEQDPGAVRGAERDRALGQEANKESLPTPVQVLPSVSSVQFSQSDPAATTPATTTNTSGTDDVHLIADDNDVIEKEWVDRAKKIVAATSADPFIESREISKLKASYMKKRFNKDIPLAGEATK